MKKFVILMLLVFLHQAFGLNQLELEFDKKEPVYNCKEQAIFIIKGIKDGKLSKQGSVALTFYIGGSKVLFSKEIDFAKENPAKVNFTSNEPNFVLVKAWNIAPKGKKSTPALAGAAFEPEKIKMGFDLPKDFKEFWESGRAKIADKDVTLTKMDKYSNAKYTSYRVAVDVLNNEKLYGFLTVPVGKGPFPALVTVPGAGPGNTLPPYLNLAAKKVIVLCMNVHKYEGTIGDSIKRREEYFNYNKKIGTRYSLHNKTNRDKYHFRNVILGVDRAINYVASMPQWDKKHFVVDGSSQGGAMAIIMTGFNKNITAAAANVPALCDHGGYKFNRKPGWPTLVNNDKAAEKVAPYYDAANFARFVTVPTLVSAGFIDETCSPSSVYAMYNQIKSSKKMINMPGIGHAVPPIYKKYKNPWVIKKLGLND